MEKVIFSREKETLLIPLYSKAKENQKESPILVDSKAAEIINKIQYDFKSLRIPQKTKMMICLRAKIIDNFVKDFLASHEDSVAVHLGCGLDSRYLRIQNSNVDWYDVDFKEVISLRTLFFKETNKYHMISSSITEEEWIQRLPEGNKHNIVIAEGLFMYLKEEDIKKLIKNLRNRLGSYTLIFDAFSVFAAKKAGSHPSIKKTGAVIQWGIDNPEELNTWDIGIEFVKEECFTTHAAATNSGLGVKVLFKIADLFSFVKRSHRLLIFKVR